MRISRYILMRREAHQERRFTEPTAIATGSLNLLMLMDVFLHLYFYICIFVFALFLFSLLLFIFNFEQLQLAPDSQFIIFYDLLCRKFTALGLIFPRQVQISLGTFGQKKGRQPLKKIVHIL